jgi:hypothetical protein
MSLLNLDSDAINKSMVEGLKEQLRVELKEELMKPVFEALKEAEGKVDKVIDELCKRVEVLGTSFVGTPFDARLKNRVFHLEWLITHVEKHEHFISDKE